MVTKEANDSGPSDKGVILTLAGIRRGGRRLFPIALFTVPFGIAFGVAAIESGLSSFQAILMSLVTFSGAAQFATLDFWTEPLAFGSLAMVVLALNARQTIMGATLAPWINRLPLSRRALVLGYPSDPNFADSQPSFQNGERDIGILLGGGLVLWACWVAGTAIGAFGGAELGDPATFGVDVVMPCFFAAAIAGQFRQVEMIAPILAASAVSVALGVLLPGWNIVLAALVGGTVGTLYHSK